MDIGIIGFGFVGSTLYKSFSILDHINEICVYDPKLSGSKFKDIINTDIVFICVPTPESIDGSCDVSVVDETIEKLSLSSYAGIVVIKSTIHPNTTQAYIEMYPHMDICFVPEFLRERKAQEDFVKNHDILIVGTEYNHIFNKVVECHGWLPDDVIMVTPTEAELAKYFNNVYNAMKIIYANAFYDLCKASNADYNKMLNAISKRNNIDKDYLDCNEELRGYAGVCLPKDTKALAQCAKSRGIQAKIFDVIVSDNKLYKSTVFKGMRKDNNSNGQKQENNISDRKRGISWPSFDKLFKRWL